MKKTETTGVERIAGRYRIEKTLGRGGMGVVYHVVDISSDRNLALKQLRARDNEQKQRNTEELFEREFYTLSHLSHPRIVDVYDYSRDDSGPFYTMELLDGGDLRELSPMPWQMACALLCDVCSALSLLHSRRFVHRDISPRNIRCTRDNKAKLIDFGGMVPMGVCKTTIGTPPFMAPEAVNLQVVDARTDLYALGATAFYALTGRHAYSGARDLVTLRDAWRSAPAPPSRFEPKIPKELDKLVISLVHLDPMARPSSAAEVIERLSTIANVRVDEQLLERQAYLSAPTLVGRDQQILQIRKQIVRAVRRRGGVLLITGASGLGRSRFLDACVLEGKLLGATVLRAEASDANAGNWAIVRTLSEQLLEATPQIAREAAKPQTSLLENLLPQLSTQFELETHRKQSMNGDTSYSHDESTWVQDESERPEGPERLRPRESILPKSTGPSRELRSQLQAALLDWLLKVSRQRCLVVAVDDIHRIDEPSAAFIALLSDQASRQRLVVVVTTETDALATSQPALSLLSQVATPIELKPLRLDETETLLGSVFGEVPNLHLMADRLHGISKGRPQTIMQLARHFLDSGLVRYQAGVWTLPDTIEAFDLPQSLSDALKARIRNLDTGAVLLAQGIALCSTQSFSFDDCLFLAGHGNKAALVRDLEQLIASDILWTDGTWYALSQSSWRSVLAEKLTEEQARVLHLRLAELLRTDDSNRRRVTQHLLRANQPEQALDMLLEDIETVGDSYLNNPAVAVEFVHSLPKKWLSTLDTLINVCKSLNRPRRQWFSLLTHVVQTAAITAQPHQIHLTEIIQQLYCDSGLDIYETLDDTMEDSARLQQTLEQAQQRYQSTPDSERVLAPAEAIPKLARIIVQAIASVGNAMDYDFFESIPSLAPLVSLSPALGVVEKNVQSSRHAIGGRFELARRGWREAIERLDQPDRAGFDPLHHTYIRLAMIYTVGKTEAFLGMRSAAKWADEIEKDPLFEVNAWRVRMLFALSQGDCRQAEQCRRRAELLQIQNSPTQFFEGLQLWSEHLGYVALENLIKVRQTLPSIENMAKRHPGWRPTLYSARGQYQKLRGDYRQAVAEFERALKGLQPGRHTMWAPTVAAYLSTLLRMGQFERLIELAESALQVAEREDPIFMGFQIRQPLSLAYAANNQFDNALENIQSVINTLEALGATGVVLGSAYETRARVAMYMNDPQSFLAFAQLCAEQYQVGHSNYLTAKYEKLMQEASGNGIEVSTELTRLLEVVEWSESTVSRMSDILSACEGARQRAQVALELLVQQGGWPGGLLYTMKTQGPVLAATYGDFQPPDDIDSLVEAFLSAEIDASDAVTLTEGDQLESPGDGSWIAPDGRRFTPFLISHESGQEIAITGVLVVCADSTDQLNVSFNLLTIISKSLMKSGDVATAYAA